MERDRRWEQGNVGKWAMKLDGCGLERSLNCQFLSKSMTKAEPIIVQHFVMDKEQGRVYGLQNTSTCELILMNASVKTFREF